MAAKADISQHPSMRDSEDQIESIDAKNATHIYALPKNQASGG